MLAGGEKIAAVARALNLRRETISRALSRPDSPLRAEVERRRAAATSTATPGELVEKAQRVLEQHLDSGDARSALDAAKVVVGKLAPQQPAEPEPAEEEISAEAAIRELAATLPTLKVVLREYPVSPEMVNELRGALRAALTDLDATPPATVAPPPSPAAPPTPPLLNQLVQRPRAGRDLSVTPGWRRRDPPWPERAPAVHEPGRRTHAPFALSVPARVDLRDDDHHCYRTSCCRGTGVSLRRLRGRVRARGKPSAQAWLGNRGEESSSSGVAVEGRAIWLSSGPRSSRAGRGAYYPV